MQEEEESTDTDIPQAQGIEMLTEQLTEEPAFDNAECSGAELPAFDSAESSGAELPAFDNAESSGAELPAFDSAESSGAELPAFDNAESSGAEEAAFDDAESSGALLPEVPAFDDAESSDSDEPEAGQDELDKAGEDELSVESEEKVFIDCPLTKSASNLLILQYSMRHSLSQEAVGDLLKLLSIHCPTPNTVIILIHFPESISILAVCGHNTLLLQFLLAGGVW